MVPLYREASALLGRFTRWEIAHVPREQNRKPTSSPTAPWTRRPPGGF
jgi:hypothetical protein